MSRNFIWLSGNKWGVYNWEGSRFCNQISMGNNRVLCGGTRRNAVPGRCSGTFFPWHRYNECPSPSSTEFWVTLRSGTCFLYNITAGNNVCSFRWERCVCIWPCVPTLFVLRCS